MTVVVVIILAMDESSDYRLNGRYLEFRGSFTMCALQCENFGDFSLLIHTSVHAE